MDPRDEHIRILARIAGIPVEEAIRKIGRDHYEDNPFDFEKGIMDSIKGVFGMGKKQAASPNATSPAASAAPAAASTSAAPAAASASAAPAVAPASAAPMVLSRPAPMVSTSSAPTGGSAPLAGTSRGGSVTPISSATRTAPAAGGSSAPAAGGSSASSAGKPLSEMSAAEFDAALGATAPAVGGPSPLQSQSQKVSEMVAKLQQERAAKDAPYIKRIQDQQAAKQAANQADIARVQQESAARKQALLDSNPLARQLEADKQARWDRIMRGARMQPPLGS